MDMHIIVPIAAGVGGLILGWLTNNLIGSKSIAAARSAAEQLLEDAASERDDLKQDLIREQADELDHQRGELEAEFQKRKSELQRAEAVLTEKELDLEKEQNRVREMETDLKHQMTEAEFEKSRSLEMKSHYKELIDRVNTHLEEIAGMTRDEALEQLKENLISEARQQSGKIIADILAEARQSGQSQAKDIILQAIHESAVEQSVETTASIVNLPDDSMKGRIIGREGRNIRSFEINTGVDVLIDDTPKVIILSCFDPVRREIAKISMERLIEDGRVHPGRIEDVVEKVTQELDDRHLEIGEQTLFELGIHNVFSDLSKLIGKLRFRTISGQNALKHSIEIAKIAASIATELKLDSNLAKRIAIFHEVGRVIDKFEVPAHERCIEALRKYKEPEAVIRCISEMQEPDSVSNPLSFVVLTAKAISNSRPGARREVYETFTERLSKLESICNSFTEVKDSYAIQIGREVRVMVDADLVDDNETPSLARTIAKKIEELLEYPGQIKVTIFREFRSIDMAK